MQETTDNLLDRQHKTKRRPHMRRQKDGTYEQRCWSAFCDKNDPLDHRFYSSTHQDTIIVCHFDLFSGRSLFRSCRWWPPQEMKTGSFTEREIAEIGPSVVGGENVDWSRILMGVWNRPFLRRRFDQIRKKFYFFARSIKGCNDDDLRTYHLKPMMVVALLYPLILF